MLYLAMNSDTKKNDKKRKIRLKELLPEFALKTGLSQDEVAKVCRLLMKQIQRSIENDEVFLTKTLTLRSSLQQARSANEKRGAIPERRVGRVIINPASKASDQ